MPPTSPEVNVPEVNPTESTPADHKPPGKFWGIVVAVALAAGLIAGTIGEFTHNMVPAPTSRVSGMGGPVDAITFKDLAFAGTANALITFAATGVVFGLISGLLGAFLGGWKRASFLAVPLGMILGGPAAFFVTKVLLRFYFHEIESKGSNTSLDLYLPFLIHASIGATLAATSAIAFATGIGARGKRFVSIVFNGLVGGVVGSIVYETIGAIAFPLSHTDRPIAAFWAPRLIGMLGVALLGTIFAAGAARNKTTA